VPALRDEERDRPAEQEERLRQAIAAAQVDLAAAHERLSERQNELEKASDFRPRTPRSWPTMPWKKEAVAMIRGGSSCTGGLAKVVLTAARGQKLSALKNALMRQRAGRSQGRRISRGLMKLLGVATATVTYAKGNRARVRNDLTPSDVAHLDPALIVGLANGDTAERRRNAAIIARLHIGVPYVAALGDGHGSLEDRGPPVIIDGDQGFRAVRS